MKQNISSTIHPASFRDRSGFIFTVNKEVYRQINNIYKDEYEKLMKSGLYDELTGKNYLLKHEEVSPDLLSGPDGYKVIKPQLVDFIIYPYEWSFSMLKDAAILLLNIQITALNYGMTLKDASAYNIQFSHTGPVLIDTLSFETYNEGEAWKAYGQFCRHYLAPLALMYHIDNRMIRLLKDYIDGIPLDLASKLLPGKTRFNFGIQTHIHLHSKFRKNYSSGEIDKYKKKISKTGLLGIIDNLKNTLKKMNFRPGESIWNDYSRNSNYTEDAFENKREIVNDILDYLSVEAGGNIIWDIGCNTCTFSKIAVEKGFEVRAMDSEHDVIEINYNKHIKGIDVFVCDITNPSGGVGWLNHERESLLDREKPDIILALALIHHLVITSGIPFRKIAEGFNEISNWALIEFVKPEDSQIKRMLQNRGNDFDDYNTDNFEMEFGKFFDIIIKKQIVNSERIVYLFKKRIDSK
ncbi:MAG: SAM-dependent methyltransferase [Bacteroidota bacterium]|nr:SAM-dependent methyltransferase [Bacteroidota bacterium]